MYIPQIQVFAYIHLKLRNSLIVHVYMYILKPIDELWKIKMDKFLNKT